ncbi:MAG TPA: O-antigen ligase family protein [Bacillota bacterium]|nr:O-antigen ligase family protein [Bacillota bacterium]HPT87751.1 O-antigen ligase family protein [Bacillota bacterium]
MMLFRTVGLCLRQSRFGAVVRYGFYKAAGGCRMFVSQLGSFRVDSSLARWAARLEVARRRLVGAYPLHPAVSQGLEILTLLYCLLTPVLKDWNGVVLLLAIQWFVRTDASGVGPFGRRLGVLAGVVGTAAVFSGGLLPGWRALYTVMTGLALAGLSAWFFTSVRREKLIRLFLCFAPVWMLIGFWQYRYVRRIPLGWLESHQYETIAVRIGSVFGNPNLYAIYLVLLMVLGLEALAKADRPWQRLGYGVILTAALWSLYGTYSRSGWLIGGLVLIWYCRNRWLRSLAGWALLVLGALLWQSGPGWARIAGLWRGMDTTLGYRFRIWQGVLQGIAEYWPWGAGPGSFGRVYPWYQADGVVAGHAHQWLLQFWLEHGLFSLLALGWVLRWLYDSARNSRLSFRLIPVTCFVGFGLAESWQASPLMNGLFWLMVGMAAAYGEENDEKATRGDFRILRPGESGG